MPDQYLLYDTAVKNWIDTQFGSIIQGKTLYPMVGTPDRAFAEYTTPTPIDPDGRPPVPRYALTLEDPELAPDRFNSNVIRKLGWSDTQEHSIRRANYPTPIDKRYTLNFWTEYRREMNLLSQKFLDLLRFQYIYIDVDIDSISPEPVYGTKEIGIFIDSGFNVTGDLEPGGKERLTRRTVNFHLKAWLWDLPDVGGSFDTAYALKEFQLETYSDEALTTLLEVVTTPQRHQVFTGATGQTVFTGSVDTAFLPIIVNTFLIDATVGGSNVRGFDDGAGTIYGTGITSGSIDYVTGALTITYDVAPDDGTPITVAYFTRVD